MSALEQKIEKLVASCGVELYDIEHAKDSGKAVFRVYITGKEGVSLEKCAEISRLLSPLLDVDEPMQESYYLEVSSPGIERWLKKAKHFESAIGERVKMKLLNNEKLEGALLSFANGEIAVETKDGQKNIKLDEIKQAKTVFEWKSN